MKKKAKSLSGLPRSSFLIFFIFLIILFCIVWWLKPNSPPIVPTPPSSEGLEIKSKANTKYGNGLKLEVYNPIDGMVVTGSTYVVDGITEPNANVEINENKLQADSNGYFRISISLGMGRSVIRVSASNKSGKYARQDIAVTRESTPSP